MPAVKTESKAQNQDWDRPTPIDWRCPRCGSHYLTPDLMPRCATCGFLESGA